MDDQLSEFDDVEQLSKGSSFIEALARYYSDFLSTDFKKGSLPKRRFQTRDKKGRRSGISLEKFPTFITQLHKSFNKDFGTGLEFVVKPKVHQASLSAIVKKAIEAQIEKVDYEKLYERNAKSISNFKIKIKKKDADLEIEFQKFIRSLSDNVGVVIGAEIINKLQPVFEKSASNLLNSLIAVDTEISDLIISPLEDQIPSSIPPILNEDDDTQLIEIIDDCFSKDRINNLLEEHFSNFSAGDLSTELRELFNLEQLDDNLEFYLYLCDVRYSNNDFPLFYIPFKIEFEGAQANLKLEPRVLINKKAVDYIGRVIQEKTGTQRASPVENRIIYIDPDDTLGSLIENSLEPILRAFQFDGDLSLTNVKSRLKDGDITLTSSLNLALFDKSDESMLTDYEELFQKLSEKSSDILTFVTNLIEGFLTENPDSITEKIYDEWDELDVPEKLIFDTPIPLAEEQRKILSALNNQQGKFITVEGPPGTGKSHTISAIAFGAILKGQSILVLSDKKEALDVVENKLNETLAKVRPTDDFVNPILRLGRVGTNFKKIVSRQSIESLRIQHREIKKEKTARKNKYDQIVFNIKKSINDYTSEAKKIKISDVYETEMEINEFCAPWEKEEGFIEIFESSGTEYREEITTIKDLIRLRKILLNSNDEFVRFSESFGDDASSIANSIEFIELVNNLASQTKIFEYAPKIDASKLEFLRGKIDEITNAKGFFGYLFSGSKIENIKSSIYEFVGFRTGETNADKLKTALYDLINRADKFYKPIEKAFDDADELIETALNIKLNDEFDDNLINSLNSFQQRIDNDYLPFLGDEETILQILTDDDSREADFYEDFIYLRNAKKELKKKFQLPDYNYMGRKNEIENFNALELASQIDERVINFANDYKNDAKTLAQIITKKKKFPRDKFDILKQAFPCMICSLRDYAEYIPLEKELFDIIIIDEASQVSIAQAFPAIIRSKKMIVLGDRKQFGNVKTSNASKELNTAYFKRVKDALEEEKGTLTSDLEERADKLNISNSILDFMESLSNFETTLKKHFRGYPEMISFSSKYFYGNKLQALKIRGKPIEDVLEFVEVEHDGQFDQYKNTNEQEVNKILELVLDQLERGDHRSACVITPHTEQQTLVSKVFSEHPKYEDMLRLLKFRSFTFDSCQGEERDIVYYSFVANPLKDRLYGVLPKSMEEQDEEELDRNKKLQRVNVAFSRGKEKLVFVHSKPISEFSAGRDALFHYKSILENKKDLPTSGDVDPNSEAEKKVLEWIKQAPFMRHNPDLETQFEIGKYLSSIDESYTHPMYRVDFLLRFNIDGKQRDIIIEYDGFEFHFENKSEVDAGNWQYYLSEKDIERQHILEAYGYKTIRLNKFNVGDDPVETINDLVEETLNQFEEEGDALIKKVLEDTAAAQEGLESGEYKVCSRCDKNKPISDFENSSTVSGYQRYCKSCKPITSRQKKRRKTSSSNSGYKNCPNCNKSYPKSEFEDRTTASGRRRLCGPCKAESVRKQELRSAEWHRRKWY